MLVLPFDLQQLLLEFEALPVSKLPAVPAPGALLALVLHAARTVREANILVQEVPRLADCANSVVVFLALVIPLLALVVPVQEELGFAGLASPSLLLLHAVVLSDFALSTAHQQVPSRTLLAVPIVVVEQAAGVVFHTVETVL